MSYSKRIPSSEIKEEVTAVSVCFAEEFGTYLGTDDYEDDLDRDGKVQYDKNGKKKRKKVGSKLTSSQLRKFFGEVKRQQMVGYKSSDFILLKPKLAYAVGRRSDKNSKICDFYEVLRDAIDIVSNEKEFKNFIKIFEAIVAYHKVAENS